MVRPHFLILIMSTCAPPAAFADGVANMLPSGQEFRPFAIRELAGRDLFQEHAQGLGPTPGLAGAAIPDGGRLAGRYSRIGDRPD